MTETMPTQTASAEEVRRDVSATKSPTHSRTQENIQWPRSPVCSERVATSDAESIRVGAPATRSQSEGFADRLWREHDVLASRLARLESAADAMSHAELSFGMLRSELDRAYELLAGQIVPHMRSADECQKALARRDYVTARARPEHEEAERLTSKLARVRERVSADNIADTRRETRRLLYELHALTRPHVGDRRALKP